MRDEVPHAGLEVGLVARDDGGHLLDVLGVLILNDVDDVVDGDDADQALLLVAHGDGGQVIAAEIVGDGLLVVGGLGADDVGVHDVADDRALGRDDQLAQGNLSDEVALIVDDEAGIDGLLVDAGAADIVHGLADGEVVVQVHILDGHQASGAVFGIIEQLIDGGAGGLIGVLEHLFDDVGRHFLQEIDGVVHEHVVHQRLDFGVGRALGDELLLVAGHVGEHVRGDVLGQHAEELDDLAAVLDLLEALGDVHREALAGLFLELLMLAGLHEREQFHKVLADFFFHRDSLLHFLSLKMREFPENGRKKAHSTRCVLQKADSPPVTGVPCGGKTQPVRRSAPDVLGVCPRCYWDSRPRLSPPWQCARRADFPRASMFNVRPKCPVVNPFRWDYPP